MIGGIVLIALTSGRLTLFMLASFPPLIGVAVLFGRRMRRVSKEARSRLIAVESARREHDGEPRRHKRLEIVLFEKRSERTTALE